MRSKSDPRRDNDSLFERAIRQTQFEQDQRFTFKMEIGLFVLLLGIIFFIRIQNLNYNTLFIDEALSVEMGEAILAGDFPDNAASWMAGSFVYPVIAALTNEFAGVVGLRLLSTISGTVAALLIFLITQRLFGQQSALWATLIFGLAGNAISLSQVAINEAIAMMFFVMAFYFFVTALLGKRQQENTRLLLAAISLAVSILITYFGLLYLPAFVLLGLALCLLLGRSTYCIVTRFLCPIIFILGAYLAYFLVDLVSMVAIEGEFITAAVDYQDVVRLLLSEIGLVIFIVLIVVLTQRGPLRQLLFDQPRLPERKMRFTLLSLKWLLGFSVLIGPLFHLATGNTVASLTYGLYSFVFLAPLAGRGITLLIKTARSGQERQQVYVRIAGATITILCLVWYVDRALDQNWGFQHGWPNVSGVVSYLRSQGVTQDSLILAEGAQIYEYYFGIGAMDKHRWNNTWYMEHGELQGPEAMQAAIMDGRFDFVVLDSYHHPQVNPALEETLSVANYTLGYEEDQRLSIGQEITLRVYVSPRSFEGVN